MPRVFLLFITVLCLFFISGCAFFRGIPSHGGGKRFDEEQRVVAGAIREMIENMEIDALEEKKVRLSLVSMPTSGSGNLSFGGLDWFGYSMDSFDMNQNMLHDNYLEEGGQMWAPAWRRYTGEDEDRERLNFRYSPNQSYYSQRVRTDDDIEYLKSVLEMQGRHQGVDFGGKNEDAVLYVLIDVLGTNRSRIDRILLKTDKLVATCESTYYAVDLSSGEILFSSRRAAGRAAYQEHRVWPLGFHFVSRTYESMPPSPFPKIGENSKHLTDDDSDHSKAPYQESDNGEMEAADLEQLTNQARIYLESGNKEAAKDIIIQILSIDPAYPGLQQLVDEFEEN